MGHQLYRDLADIIQPHVGKTEHHVDNSKEPVNEVKELVGQEN